MAVVQMFIEDVFTGLRVPNRPSKPVYVTLNYFGQALACYKTRNEAVNAVSMSDDEMRWEQW